MKEHEFDRTARAWLDEGPTEISDRVVQSALDEVHLTRQRLAWWPGRRYPQMSNLMRAIAAAVVVAAVGVAVINVLPGRNGTGGPPPTPSPTPSPTSEPTAETTPSASATPPLAAILSPGPLCTSGGCQAGILNPGTYSFEAGTVAPRRLTFTVPRGWAINKDGFVTKGDSTNGVALITWTVTHVYTDICQHDGALVSAGTTATELADLLAAQKGRVASPVTDVNLGGFPAKRVELFVPAELDVSGCDSGIIRFWPDPGPDETGGLCCSQLQSTDVVYVVDVPDNRFTVVARHNWDSIRADVAELNGVVASMQIDDAASGSPSPSTP